MHPMTQLDQLRRQMAEELTQIPQYRALKTMERFIAEMSAVYEATPEEAKHTEDEESNSRIAQAIESHLRGESGPSVVKNTAYLPCIGWLEQLRAQSAPGCARLFRHVVARDEGEVLHEDFLDRRIAQALIDIDRDAARQGGEIDLIDVGEVDFRFAVNQLERFIHDKTLRVQPAPVRVFLCAEKAELRRDIALQHAIQNDRDRDWLDVPDIELFLVCGDRRRLSLPPIGAAIG